jgi:hypothetical protein
VEVFGDPPRVLERGTFRLARLRLNTSITVLDLRGRGAMVAGIAAGISGTETRSLTQSWARYFYDAPGIYGAIGGLLYANSHNGMDALALFERAQPAIDGATQQVKRLANSALYPELLRIAADNGLTLA